MIPCKKACAKESYHIARTRNELCDRHLKRFLARRRNVDFQIADRQNVDGQIDTIEMSHHL
jgi:hypothetical protein